MGERIRGDTVEKGIIKHDRWGYLVLDIVVGPTNLPFGTVDRIDIRPRLCSCPLFGIEV